MSMRIAGGDDGEGEFRIWCVVTGEIRWRWERASSSISSIDLDSGGAMDESSPENLSSGMSISWLGVTGDI